MKMPLSFEITVISSSILAMLSCSVSAKGQSSSPSSVDAIFKSLSGKFVQISEFGNATGNGNSSIAKSLLRSSYKCEAACDRSLPPLAHGIYNIETPLDDSYLSLAETYCKPETIHVTTSAQGSNRIHCFIK